MFEFEFPGTIDDLKAMEYELCEYLGFKKSEERTYADWQKHYELGALQKWMQVLKLKCMNSLVQQ